MLWHLLWVFCLLEGFLVVLLLFWQFWVFFNMQFYKNDRSWEHIRHRNFVPKNDLPKKINENT